MLFGHFVADDGFVGPGNLFFLFLEIFFQVCYGLVFQTCGCFKVAFSLCIFEAVLGFFDFFLEVFYLVDITSFTFPLRGQFFVLLLKFDQLLFGFF